MDNELPVPNGLLRLCFEETGKAVLMKRPSVYERVVERAIKHLDLTQRLAQNEEEIFLESVDHTEILPETWSAFDGLPYFRNLYVQLRDTNRGVVAKPETEETGQSQGMDVTPDEPRYCFCNKRRDNTMIKCGNDDCSTTWFHPACAGVERSAARTKWYCRGCQVEPPSPKSLSSVSSNGRGALSSEPRPLSSRKRTTKTPYDREISRMSSHGRESAAVRPIKLKRKDEVFSALRATQSSSKASRSSSRFKINARYGKATADIEMKPSHTISKVLDNLCAVFDVPRAHAKLIRRDTSDLSNPHNSYRCYAHERIDQLKPDDTDIFILQVSDSPNSDSEMD